METMIALVLFATISLSMAGLFFLTERENKDIIVNLMQEIIVPIKKVYSGIVNILNNEYIKMNIPAVILGTICLVFLDLSIK